MSKHTAGPWEWDEPSNWHGLEARVFVPEPYGCVARIPIEAWRPRSVGRANARLIAAAPELLEALKQVIPYMEAREAALLVGDEGCHWPVEIVRAAISKADQP